MTNGERRVAERIAVCLVTACLFTAVLGGCQIFNFLIPDRRVEERPERPPVTPQVQADKLAEATAARDAGEYEVALTIFREILAENPTVTTAYLGIGEIYLEQEDYAAAEPAFARAARLEPRNFDAQYGHGVALQMLRRFSEAIRAYHRALTINPDHPRANLNMATTYLQMGDHRAALLFAEKAVETDQSNAAARINLGAIYEELGRYADASTQYEAALELSEPTPPLLMNLINALSRQQRYHEAANAAEYLVSIEPSAQAYERLGWAKFRIGNYEQSLDAYRRAVELDSSHWPALNGIGVNALNKWLLSDRQDADARREARDAFRRSLRTNPDQPRIVKLLTDYQL